MFSDRKQAGKKLAGKLKKYQNKNCFVLALPRGGLPIGYEISRLLHLPLDVLVIRKIGTPNNPELALGAIGPEGICFLDRLTIKRLGITPEEIENNARQEIIELIRRQKEYRNGLPPLQIKGEIIILVDDGIATGASIQAAIRAAHKQNPQKLVLAVPVCPKEVANEIRSLVDEFICLEEPLYFNSVGEWYKNFTQITDNEVKKLLQKSKQK